MPTTLRKKLKYCRENIISGNGDHVTFITFVVVSLVSPISKTILSTALIRVKRAPMPMRDISTAMCRFKCSESATMYFYRRCFHERKFRVSNVNAFPLWSFNIYNLHKLIPSFEIWRNLRVFFCTFFKNTNFNVPCLFDFRS